MDDANVIDLSNTAVVHLKWFNFSQNNSGGYFIKNDTVDEEVFIQARNAAEAISTAERLFAPYSEYCECCGERWSYWVTDEDGCEQPSLYGIPISDAMATWCRKQAKLHYYDGRVQTFVFHPQGK